MDKHKNLKLYDVSKEYVNYLKNAEIQKRGFTKVPDMDYDNREQKYLCGVVLEVKGLSYYVPVSSQKRKQSDNILIEFPNDTYNKVKGSLGFCYMFPIPKEMVTIRYIPNEQLNSRKVFLSKTLSYINSIREQIYEQAERTYDKVISSKNIDFNNICCDYKLLESKCVEYSIKHSLELPEALKPQKNFYDCAADINKEIAENTSISEDGDGKKHVNLYQTFKSVLENHGIDRIQAVLAHCVKCSPDHYSQGDKDWAAKTDTSGIIVDIKLETKISAEVLSGYAVSAFQRQESEKDKPKRLDERLKEKQGLIPPFGNGDKGKEEDTPEI